MATFSRALKDAGLIHLGRQRHFGKWKQIRQKNLEVYGKKTIVRQEYRKTCENLRKNKIGFQTIWRYLYATVTRHIFITQDAKESATRSPRFFYLNFSKREKLQKWIEYFPFGNFSRRKFWKSRENNNFDGSTKKNNPENSKSSQ